MLDDSEIEMYEEMSLMQLVSAQKEADEKLKDALNEVKKHRRILDSLRKHVLPDRLNEMGLQNATFPGIGRVSLRNDAYVSTRADQKPQLLEWLDENDFGELITATVNASTLKAFIKEQDGLGNPVPSEEIISYTPYQYTSVTKA